MTQIVINRCERGTLLSEAGLLEYINRKHGGVFPPNFNFEDIDRTAPELIAMMATSAGREKFGGHCAHISVVDMPDGFKWKIMRKGTWEWVAADV